MLTHNNRLINRKSGVFKVVGRVIKRTFPLGTEVCVKSVNKSQETFALMLCSVNYQM